MVGWFSSHIPCRATLSWGKDDRKSSRWHRAGLQHVTSSLESQEARGRGGRSEKEEGGGMRLSKEGEEMGERCMECSRLSQSTSYISVSSCSTTKIRDCDLWLFILF